MFQTNVVEKIQTYFMLKNFFPKIVPFMYNIEKFGRARGVTSDVKIWRKRVACWISKATRARTCIRPRPQTHTRTRNHERTHREISNTS